MPEIYGIDVSKYQGVVDYKLVKTAGKKFVFVRLGWAGWDGVISLDSMAVRNITEAKNAGLAVGIYVYSYCKTEAAAKTAAKQTIEKIRPYLPLAYPIAFDIEDTSTSGTPYQNYGRDFNSSIVKAFLSEIEAAGFYGMLYTYKSFAESYLNMESLKSYDVWIAQYASKCSYKGDYGIWQYAGDTGSCIGVTGACDLNISYRDYAEVIEKAGLNGFPKNQDDKAAGTDASTGNDELREQVSKLTEKLKKISDIVNDA